MAQVRRILGPPSDRDKYQDTEIWFYHGRGGFVVEFARAKVATIAGISLCDGEEIVLQRGDSRQKVLQLLGSPIPGGSLGSASAFRCNRFRLYVTILENNTVESIELMRGK